VTIFPPRFSASSITFFCAPLPTLFFGQRPGKAGKKLRKQRTV
jgi:hypothetical protein